METLRPAAPCVTVVLPVYQAALSRRGDREHPRAEPARLRADRGRRRLDATARPDPRALREARSARERACASAHAGVIRARNAGLSLARAPLVACMDADDVSLPDRLALQVSALDRPARRRLHRRRVRRDRRRGIGCLNRVLPPCEHAAIVAMALLGRSPICGSNAMFRRREVLAIGGYDESRRLRGGPRPVAASRRDRPARESPRRDLARALPRRLAERDAAGAPARRDPQRRESRAGAAGHRGADRAPASLAPARHAPLAPRVRGGLGALGVAARASAARRCAYAARALRIDPLGAPLWKGLARGFTPAVHEVRVPEVSVMMPVYDAEAYLAEALESILAQTFGDFELIASTTARATARARSSSAPPRAIRACA